MSNVFVFSFIEKMLKGAPSQNSLRISYDLRLGVPNHKVMSFKASFPNCVGFKRLIER
jgi:hypothetical protein